MRTASRSRGATASVHEDEDSPDELAEWHGGWLLRDESECGKSVDEIIDMLVDEDIVIPSEQDEAGKLVISALFSVVDS